MIRKWYKNKFIQSSWRFVGKLPRQYDRNLFLITPDISHSDYFNFYLAISSIIQMNHRLYIRSRFSLRLVSLLLIRNHTYFKKSAQSIDQLFTAKQGNYRQINLAVAVSDESKYLKGIDLKFYDYASKNRIPITLITIDRVEKMVKFHTAFYSSKNQERDLEFIYRYFKSHQQKNELFNFRNS